jgi:hypothetical protein
MVGIACRLGLGLPEMATIERDLMDPKEVAFSEVKSG